MLTAELLSLENISMCILQPRCTYSMDDHRAKVWFVFAKPLSPLLRKLSTNLLREICSYMQAVLYPIIFNTHLSVWNLTTGQATTSTLSRSFGSGSVYCLYRPSALLCVGNYPSTSDVFEISLGTAALAPLPAMSLDRAWPGIIAWKSHAYIFGGNYLPPSKEAEKFHISDKQWSSVPPMNTPRLAFTPLLHKDKFLLISSAPGSTPVESFSPVSETYEGLSLDVNGSGYGAIAFLREKSVSVILYGGSLLRWQPGEPSFHVSPLSLPDMESAITAAPPAIANNAVYWEHYSKGGIVKFDLMTLNVTWRTTSSNESAQ